MPPGWRTVQLRQEVVQKVVEKIHDEYGEALTKPAIGAYAGELILSAIEGDEIMRRYGPFLEELGVDPDHVFIKDNRTNTIAELTFRDKLLFCNLDNSDNCVHIGFAWAIPKVYKVMQARGEKKPGVKR